jgi:predicted  nucleic acid-binding Zn-ribbon protein
VIDLMAESLGSANIPGEAPATKRVAMEEMCAILCRHDKDAQAVVAKYDALKDKHRRLNGKVKRLSGQCSGLRSEIDANRQTLADQMDAVRAEGGTTMDRRLNRLEEMVKVQIEDQQTLVAGTPKSTRSCFERKPIRPA